MNKAASSISEEERRSAPIVVGVDGSNVSRRALAWAAQEAEIRGNTVLAISTYQIPAMATADLGFSLASVDVSELAEYTQRVLATEIAEVTTRHPKVRIEAKVVEGSAAQVLIDASQLASVLVVGSRGHGGFVGLLLGSVSQQCVTHARCPVVAVVRPSAQPDQAEARQPGPAGQATVS